MHRNSIVLSHEYELKLSSVQKKPFAKNSSNTSNYHKNYLLNNSAGSTLKFTLENLNVCFQGSNEEVKNLINYFIEHSSSTREEKYLHKTDENDEPIKHDTYTEKTTFFGKLFNKTFYTLYQFLCDDSQVTLFLQKLMIHIFIYIYISSIVITVFCNQRDLVKKLIILEGLLIKYFSFDLFCPSMRVN